MTDKTFRALLCVCAGVFLAYFCFTVIPPLIENPDIPGAFAAGFVNPYASGYSTDVIICWVILAVWVVFEARQYSVRGGWVCVLLGLVPGVAVGFAAYLYIRQRQLQSTASES